jgi:hypothetical protein
MHDFKITAMKQLLFALIVCVTLLSCSTSYDVRLRNGTIVKAVELDGRDFNVGDTVCVNAPAFYGSSWEINRYGSMRDTMYSYRSYDSTLRIFEQRIGVIKGGD